MEAVWEKPVSMLFVHHKSHMDWPRDQTQASVMRGQQTANDRYIWETCSIHFWGRSDILLMEAKGFLDMLIPMYYVQGVTSQMSIIFMYSEG